MSDRSLNLPHERKRRGKNAGPGRREPGRNVRDANGDIVAHVLGRHVTDDDVEQARLLVRWMPDYTAAIGGGDG